MLPRTYYADPDTRRHQIDTLKIFNDHVTEIAENSEYRVDFTTNGKNMCLSVILGPDFPAEKPSIYISPAILHPWLAENSNQVVKAPGLMNFTLHSDLGRVVQAIIREFKNSFQNRTGQEESANKSPQLHLSPQSHVSPQLNVSSRAYASPKLHVSGQALMFPELNEFTVEELQEILENTDLQDKIIESNPQLVELDLETEELMNNIERIAQDNIAKQQMLDNIKTEVIDRISTIVQMKMNYEELNKKHQKLSEMYDPHRIRDCLKEAALKADEDAENIAEQFLLGNVPVETFVLKFAEKRALGQARRAREERLGHQLAQLDRATT